jgi:hypothetical protein
VRSSEVDFQFPVLGLSTDNDAWGFPDLKGLTTCGPKTLRDRMQEGMELIDISGSRWRVNSVKSLGRADSIFTRWLMVLLTGVPQFRIEQELEALPGVSLEGVQEKVCAAMEAHPEFWCEDDERDTVLPKRLAEVRATGNIAAIHEVLGLDTFEAY